ncbi:MAG: hypothetical protein BMS9Abin08_0203 [Gammaproteobacteria bacterium]|nr:MAG: hypothetical protein BMS9Abin08_0203 [Gammaproteobacteria bacterium]
MCSTPRSSGKSRPVEHFRDEPDYSSYSAMLRRASRRMDRKDQQREEQRDQESSHRNSANNTMPSTKR